MYLKPACSVLSSSPFCVRAMWAMLLQRCSRLDDVMHLAAHLLLERRRHRPGCSRTRAPAATAAVADRVRRRDSPRPVPSSPPPRSCPRGSAGTGTTACSRGSRPRSSPRAVGRRCSRGSCRVVFGFGRSWCGLLVHAAGGRCGRYSVGLVTGRTESA